MAKRAPPIVYTGSLKKNFWGNIVKMHFGINMKDYYAYNFFKTFAKHINEGRYKNLNPEFVFSYEYLDGKEKHTNLTITWITKMERKIYLHRSRDDIMSLYSIINYYNSICEDERDEQGHDDEPEDEISLL